MKGVPNFGEIDAFIICVSTHKPDDMSTPQIEGLLSVVQEISMKAKNGAIVSIESTIPRGTSKKVFEMLNHRLHVVHVPHRWYALEEMEHGVNQPRVKGGVQDCCLRAALQFYTEGGNSNHNENRNLGIPLHPVSDIEIAEITKIAENAHRYLQIVFAEDLYLYCQSNNVDFQELRVAVNTKWNIDILEPRDGIGGHCLPKDTKMFLQSSQSSKRGTSKILSAALEVDQDYRRSRKVRGTSFQQNIIKQSNNNKDLRRGDLTSVIRHAI
jgi:UDP-N-acetyl-D-mannosaminuronic acid dehydrogenase